MTWQEIDWFLRTAEQFAECAKSVSLTISLESAHTAIRDAHDFLVQAKRLCEAENRAREQIIRLEEDNEELKRRAEELEDLEERNEMLRDELNALKERLEEANESGRDNEGR